MTSGSAEFTPLNVEKTFDFRERDLDSVKDGVIPAGTSSAEFDKAYDQVSTIRNSRTTAANYLELFSRVLGSHAGGAKRLVLIDKYAAKGIYAQQASFNRILWDLILQNPGLEVEIHTTIDYNFYSLEEFDDGESPAEEKRSTQWYRQAELDLTAAVADDRSKIQARNSSLSIHVYRNKPFSREPSTFEFPHDRHVQFEFLSSVGGYISDYFQLGLGVETFSAEQLRETGGRGADIYPSDAEKMWSEFTPVRKKLLVGSIAVQGDEFGNKLSSALDFVRASRF